VNTAKEGVRRGIAVANGTDLARLLGNRPGNLCTPGDLADQARALKKAHPALKVQILEEKDMAKLGMGALLSVSRGSRQPAKLIIMQYKGGATGENPWYWLAKASPSTRAVFPSNPALQWTK